MSKWTVLRYSTQRETEQQIPSKTTISHSEDVGNKRRTDRVRPAVGQAGGCFRRSTGRPWLVVWRTSDHPCWSTLAGRQPSWSTAAARPCRGSSCPRTISSVRTRRRSCTWPSPLTQAALAARTVAVSVKDRRRPPPSSRATSVSTSPSPCEVSDCSRDLRTSRDLVSASCLTRPQSSWPTSLFVWWTCDVPWWPGWPEPSETGQLDAPSSFVPRRSGNCVSRRRRTMSRRTLYTFTRGYHVGKRLTSKDSLIGSRVVICEQLGLGHLPPNHLRFFVYQIWCRRRHPARVPYVHRDP